MLLKQTISALRELRMLGFIDALEQQLSQPAISELSFEERLSILVDAEISNRSSKKFNRHLKLAKFKDSAACIENIDFSPLRKINRSMITTLSSCNWIELGQNLIVTGPCGSGKTWMSCAFGNQACRKGYTSRYFRLPLLIEQIATAKADGSINRFRAQISKTSVIILDDWLMTTLDALAAREILELFDERTKGRSLILASQHPVSTWHARITEPTIADAILDRIVHTSHRIEIAGESMRKRQSIL